MLRLVRKGNALQRSERHRSGLLAYAILAMAAAPAAAGQTVPHEAHYNVTVERLRTPGEVVSAAGEMAMRVQRDCEKWTLQHETNFGVQFVGGDEFRVETLYRIHEGLDGKRLDFRAQTKMNGAVVVNSKGTALMSADGSGGKVEFRLPEPRSVGLPAGTGFPLRVANRSIESLKTGKSINRYVLFDGIGLYQVTDIAAGGPIPLSTRPQGDVDLLAVQSWKVESTLFPYGVVDAEPAGSVVTQTQENGIATAFLADYGRLIARGELTSIRRLPEPDC